jgi:CopG-like RHH_1 or ribbon-helix-helix domain, RHH_5
MNTIQVEVPEDLAAAFQRHANEAGRTVSELAAEALELYLAKNSKRRGAHSVLDIQPGSLGTSSHGNPDRNCSKTFSIGRIETCSARTR